MHPLALRLSMTTACILSIAGTAIGQNALGGGRALDGGLSATPGGRINASTQDLQAIVRYNTNAGNALNGPGMITRVPLGNSGYVGSSGLARDAGLLSSSGSSLGGYTSGSFDRMIAIESGYLPGGALTSSITLPQGSSASDYFRGADQSVGYTRDRRGDVYLARGSSLRGLTIEPITNPNPAYDPTKEPPTTGTAANYGRVIDELRRASLARALENPQRVNNSATAEPPVPPAPKPPEAAAKPTPGSDTSAPNSPSSTAPSAATAKPPAAPVQYDPNATLKRLRDKLGAEKPKRPAPTETARIRKPDGVTTPDPSNSAATDTLTEQDIAALKNMGLRLDSLVPPGATDAQASDGYTRLGQEALAVAQFGLAEQMFQAAINRNPANVLAKAGCIHATMGLGLLMTAGTDLRQYFVDHPEMIPVRFSDNVLMPRPRANRMAEMLVADIDLVDGPVLDNAGLTLAYLGRQFDNPSWLDKGLAAMAVQTKGDAQGTELQSILVRVWNPQAVPAAVPAPATPPATPEAPPAKPPAAQPPK